MYLIGKAVLTAVGENKTNGSVIFSVDQERTRITRLCRHGNQDLISKLLPGNYACPVHGLNNSSSNQTWCATTELDEGPDYSSFGTRHARAICKLKFGDPPSQRCVSTVNSYCDSGVFYGSNVIVVCASIPFSWTEQLVANSSHHVTVAEDTNSIFLSHEISKGTSLVTGRVSQTVPTP